MVPPARAGLPRACPHPGAGTFFNSRERLPFLSSCDGGHGATRGVVLTLPESMGLGGQEFLRCPIINGHMSCGSRFPPHRQRSSPILAVRPTLKLAVALVRQAAIPSRGIGALSRRRSLAGRAGAHPCSTPYSVERSAGQLKRLQCCPMNQ